MKKIPDDLRSEVLANYLHDISILLLGPHKRDAYQDIVSLEQTADGHVQLGLSRKGLYDILPEALFHPLNRFDNIRANNYEERFAEECRKQYEEEENARAFFKPFDSFLFQINCILANEKEKYSDDGVLCKMICDKVGSTILMNRFVKRTMPYMPLCKAIRGNSTLMTMLLRKVLMQEGMELVADLTENAFTDCQPRYVCAADEATDIDNVYLGNEFVEDFIVYRIKFWDEGECDDYFLRFVEELTVYQNFLNDFFMGVETTLRFELETTALPLRLSDEVIRNYLNYNTNL